MTDAELLCRLKAFQQLIGEVIAGGIGVAAYMRLIDIAADFDVFLRKLEREGRASQ